MVAVLQDGLSKVAGDREVDAALKPKGRTGDDDLVWTHPGDVHLGPTKGDGHVSFKARPQEGHNGPPLGGSPVRVHGLDLHGGPLPAGVPIQVIQPELSLARHQNPPPGEGLKRAPHSPVSSVRFGSNRKYPTAPSPS